jgi:hypothetical protein
MPRKSRRHSGSISLAVRLLELSSAASHVGTRLRSGRCRTRATPGESVTQGRVLVVVQWFSQQWNQTSGKKIKRAVTLVMV